MKYLAGTLLFLVLSVSVYAEQAVLEYAYSEPFTADPEQAQAFDELSELFKTDLDQAATRAHEYANKLLASEKHTENPAEAGQMLSNAAIAEAALGNYDRAAQTFEQALKLIEAEYQVFSPYLVNTLLASGITSIQLKKMQDAENKFRWAQHIQHRADGVFSLSQTESIDWLTRLHLLQQQFAAADLTQNFGLRVAESNFALGTDSLSDARLKAAIYFSDRGSKLPYGVDKNYLLSRDNMFRQSVTLYKSAIVSIEASYGHNDPRLIEPLKRFAKTRTKQRTNARAAIPLLERVLDIISQQNEADPVDLIRAWLELADVFIITGDRKASATYAEAWALLEQIPGEPAMKNNLFSEPKLLYPNKLTPLILERRPEATSPDEDEYYVDISYVIGKMGKVSKIDILDKNVPNTQARLLKSLLKGSRFRPRLVAGEPQEFTKTERHFFYLLEKDPESTNAETPPQESEAIVATDDAQPDEIETPQVD